MVNKERRAALVYLAQGISLTIGTLFGTSAASASDDSSGIWKEIWKGKFTCAGDDEYIAAFDITEVYTGQKLYVKSLTEGIRFRIEPYNAQPALYDSYDDDDKKAPFYAHWEGAFRNSKIGHYVVTVWRGTAKEMEFSIEVSEVVKNA